MSVYIVSRGLLFWTLILSFPLWAQEPPESDSAVYEAEDDEPTEETESAYPFSSGASEAIVAPDPRSLVDEAVELELGAQSRDDLHRQINSFHASLSHRSEKIDQLDVFDRMLVFFRLQRDMFREDPSDFDERAQYYLVRYIRVSLREDLIERRVSQVATFRKEWTEFVQEIWEDDLLQTPGLFQSPEHIWNEKVQEGQFRHIPLLFEGREAHLQFIVGLDSLPIEALFHILHPLHPGSLAGVFRSSKVFGRSEPSIREKTILSSLRAANRLLEQGYPLRGFDLRSGLKLIHLQNPDFVAFASEMADSDRAEMLSLARKIERLMSKRRQACAWTMNWAMSQYLRARNALGR